MNPAGLLAIAIELDAFPAQAQSIINEIIGGEFAVVEPWEEAQSEWEILRVLLRRLGNIEYSISTGNTTIQMAL